MLVEILAVIAFSTLFSLGGGNGQLAIIQDHWVDPGLLSPALFAWAYAIGNFVPGPKCSFVAGIGYFLAGFPGAIACLVGISIPTVLGASLAAHWHDNSETLCGPIYAGIWVRDRGDDANRRHRARSKYLD